MTTKIEEELANQDIGEKESKNGSRFSIKKKLGVKLILAFLLVSLIPFVILGAISLKKSSDSLHDQAFNQLESLRTVKGEAVASFFETINNQVITFSSNRMIIDAMWEFRTSFRSFSTENSFGSQELEKMRTELKTYYTGEFSDEYKKINEGKSPDAESLFRHLDDESVALQYKYIRENENPLGSKHLMDDSGDNSSYSQLHSLVHPIMKKYLEKFGYYDIFLVDNNTGDIVYSVYKELDFTTSLIDGPYAETNFGEAFRKANEAGNKDAVVLVDYKQYKPSYEAPASFIASPIFEGDEKIGVLMFQMPTDRLNEIMSQREGLGETGETYLVGPDKLMRSDSFADPENHSIKASFNNPELGSVDTLATREALTGTHGEQVIMDYNGKQVLSSYGPLKIGGHTWALIAEIDEAEAFAPITQLKWAMAIVFLIGTVAILAVSLLISRSITKPIQTTVEGIKKIAAGDFTTEISVKSEDEVGVLASEVNRMVVELREMFQNIIQSSRILATASEELAAVSTQLASGSEEMSSQANGVASATEQMSANINSMASGVEEASVNSSSVSSTAEQMSTNMRTIASAIEEMTVSINDVARNAQETSKVAGQAMDMSHTATETMKTLGASAGEIGKVTEMIKRIAEQTNLLALNATIEAASAGEAGKGFAVVANEIKELANQSAKAAEEIASKIGGVQTSTKDAVDVISSVSDIIGKINESIAVITNSVDQQAKAADEVSTNVSEVSKGANNIASSIAEIAKGASDMSKNAGEAAKGSDDVSSNIQGISKAVLDNNSGIQQINSSSGELAKIATQLQAMMDKFTVKSNGRVDNLSASAN